MAPCWPMDPPHQRSVFGVPVISSWSTVPFRSTVIGPPNVCDITFQNANQIITTHAIFKSTVMDASGRMEAAFVFGNNFWLGSKSSCARVTDPHPVRLDPRYQRSMLANLTAITAPMSITYRMVYAKHFSPLQYDLKIYDKVSKSDPVAVPILGSGWFERERVTQVELLIIPWWIRPLKKSKVPFDVRLVGVGQEWTVSQRENSGEPKCSRTKTTSSNAINWRLPPQHVYSK